MIEQLKRFFDSMLGRQLLAGICMFLAEMFQQLALRLLPSVQHG
jgi:hypothetical protein